VAVRRDEDRYTKMSASSGVRNIDGYNARLMRRGSKVRISLAHRAISGLTRNRQGCPMNKRISISIRSLHRFIILPTKLPILMMVAGRTSKGLVQRLLRWRAHAVCT